MENFDIVNEIYNEVFCNIQHRNIDLFLCGAASTKEKYLIGILSGVN